MQAMRPTTIMFRFMSFPSGDLSSFQHGIRKALLRTPRCHVDVRLFGGQCEVRSQAVGQGAGTVSLDRESAALLWPVEPEGRDDHRCARSRGRCQRRDVGLLRLGGGEEMEGRAINFSERAEWS